MSLSDFWAQLQAKAMPSVQAEVERRGWRLLRAEHGHWSAERKNVVWAENGDGPLETWLCAIEASDLLAKIDRYEAAIGHAPWGADVFHPSRLTEDSEVAP